MREVSLSSINRVLKEKLQMSYKKLSNISPKVFTDEKKRQMLESAYLLHHLRKKKYEIIFLDEFSFSERNSKAYGW
jgi:predicted AAA+ superfamily ATPase